MIKAPVGAARAPRRRPLLTAGPSVPFPSVDARAPAGALWSRVSTRSDRETGPGLSGLALSPRHAGTRRTSRTPPCPGPDSRSDRPPHGDASPIRYGQNETCSPPPRAGLPPRSSYSTLPTWSTSAQHSSVDRSAAGVAYLSSKPHSEQVSNSPVSVRSDPSGTATRIDPNRVRRVSWAIGNPYDRSISLGTSLSLILTHRYRLVNVK